MPDCSNVWSRLGSDRLQTRRRTRPSASGELSGDGNCGPMCRSGWHGSFRSHHSNRAAVVLSCVMAERYQTVDSVQQLSQNRLGRSLTPRILCYGHSAEAEVLQNMPAANPLSEGAFQRRNGMPSHGADWRAVHSHLASGRCVFDHPALSLPDVRR